MIDPRKLSCVCIFGSLAACGGSGGPALPLVNTDGATFASDGETALFTTDTFNIELPLDAEFDRGPFVGAANLDDDRRGYILAFSETKDSFAGLLIDRTGDIGTQSEQFFGRTRAVEALSDGTATLSGTYVGVRNNPNSDFLLYFTGNAEFRVNFDEATIAGDVDDITLQLELFGEDSEFVYSQRIALLETSISRDGSFIGDVQNIEIETGESFDTGTYQGLFAGSDSQEVVGTISGNAVFVAGH